MVSSKVVESQSSKVFTFQDESFEKFDLWSRKYKCKLLAYNITQHLSNISYPFANGAVKMFKIINVIVVIILTCNYFRTPTYHHLMVLFLYFVGK